MIVRRRKLKAGTEKKTDASLRDKLSYRSVDVLQWCVYAVVVGVVCGAVAAAFGMTIDAATEARQQYDWLV